MDAKENREQIIRDAKSGLILDAARKVFAEKGFHDTHLEEIAAAAGFSKAALYNYYSDKETIFLSLANRDFDHLLQQMKNNLHPEAKFIGEFEKMARIVFSFFGDHFAFVLTTVNYRSTEKAKNEKIPDCHDTLSTQFNKKFASVFDVFIQMIGDAKKKGEIDCNLDDQVISNYITSLVRGVILEWKIQGKKGDIDNEINQLVVFLNHGLNLRGK
jgi:AcrR family transcriptional regulator